MIHPNTFRLWNTHRTDRGCRKPSRKIGLTIEQLESRRVLTIDLSGALSCAPWIGSAELANSQSANHTTAAIVQAVSQDVAVSQNVAEGWRSELQTSAMTLGNTNVNVKSLPSGEKSTPEIRRQDHSDGSLELLIPLYQYPLSAPNTLSGWWQQVLAGATAETPITIIANPGNGPVATTNPTFVDWISALSLMRSNPNIRILGYVKSLVSPGSDVLRTPAEIMADVNAYGTDYRHPTTNASFIDGIFVDEMSNLVANVATYSSVATGIRSNTNLAGQFIVGNPGTAVPIEYLDQATADAFIIREGTPNDFVNNAVPDYVASEAYASTGFGAIVYDAADTQSMVDILREAKLRKLDYIFVTDDAGNNPFNASPTYFSQLLRDLHAPYIGSATLELLESAAVGTLVGVPTAGDPDAGQTISYAIVGGNTGDTFAIDSATGEIRVASTASLDFATNPLFNLLVRVTDSGTPSLSDESLVTIQLLEDLSDRVAPQVVRMMAASSNWSANFIDTVDGAGVGDGNKLGFELVDGGAPLAWADVDRLYIQFSEAVGALSPSFFELRDSTGVIPFALTYDPTSLIATLALESPLAFSKVRLAVSDQVVDTAGNPLDGDKDGVAGGIVNFRFDIMPGDATGDGRTDSDDLTPFSQAFNTRAQMESFISTADWNADGRVNGADLIIFSLYFDQDLTSLSEPGNPFLTLRSRTR